CLSFSCIRSHLTSLLLPYTTLFRSYISDVFADRRLPTELATDDVMVGECLGGAMYTEDFRRLMFDLGVKDFRVMSKTQIALHNRSEEHTSELQSRENLVCRLLLEKK